MYPFFPFLDNIPHKTVDSFMKKRLFRDGKTFWLTLTDTFELSTFNETAAVECIDRSDGITLCSARVENILFEHVVWVSLK